MGTVIGGEGFTGSGEDAAKVRIIEALGRVEVIDWMHVSREAEAGADLTARYLWHLEDIGLLRRAKWGESGQAIFKMIGKRPLTFKRVGGSR